MILAPLARRGYTGSCFSSIMYYLGIEIGGTKLQLGIGAGDGRLSALLRRTVVSSEGADGIRRQIVSALPELLERAGIPRDQFRGVGIGFGGPVDDATKTVIRSHQIEGWDGFPLADWVSDLVGLPAVLGNDADVAGLAEALHGAGKGLSPIFYVTIGSGIGGGLIIDEEIYRGVGRGAAEIGHLYVGEMVGSHPVHRPLERFASGWGMEELARRFVPHRPQSLLSQREKGDCGITANEIARAAEEGDETALEIIDLALDALAAGIQHVITLLCPRRIVVGGGVALMGDSLLFVPLRTRVAQHVFAPFAGLTDIVPAELGEAVVVHGAVCLARKRLEGR